MDKATIIIIVSGVVAGLLVAGIMLLNDKKNHRGVQYPSQIAKRMEEELKMAEENYKNAYIPVEIEKYDKQRREIVKSLSTEYADYTDIDYRAYVFYEKKKGNKQ